MVYNGILMEIIGISVMVSIVFFFSRAVGLFITAHRAPSSPSLE